jgi:Cep192 domain 4
LSAKRLHRWLVGWFAVLMVVQPQNSLAEPLDHWQLKAPFPQWPSIRISYGNGIFVAMGEPGALYTSPDGETWTWGSSGTSQSLRDVSYGGGTFVAVGEEGTILSSPDGVIWTGCNSGTGYHLNGVSYGEGIFVAVGDEGAILASSDGLTWSARDSGTHQGINKIAFGKGIFVAAGRNGTLLTSADGAVWTPQSSGTHGHLDGIAYGKDTFVAVGEAILTSSDGKVWAEKKARGSHRIFGVAYGGGLFAAVADNGGILTSSDASEWTARDTGTHLTLFAIAHGKERFLASGERGILLLSEPLPSAQISVSSSSLDFGEVRVGDSSFTNLTISNSGSANLIIRQITLSGTDTLDFNTRDDNCTGATLPSSQNCSVQIVFLPRSAGPKSATLSVSSNDPDTPTQTVSLSGSGTDGGAIVSSGSTGFFCFFSTSVRGTGLEDYLEVLRKFRDTILSRSDPGKRLVDFYYQHSPALARMIAQHDFLRKAMAFGLVPPLAAIAYITLYASPAEKAILFLLIAGGVFAGWRLIRESARAKSFMIRSPACMQLSR